MADSFQGGLKIDPEFKKLIPPLTEEEYEQLEKNIVADGCREPLVVWREFILDGHNRYSICSRHGIAYQTVEKHFSSRDDAIVWICSNQLGRRNIPEETRKYLIGKRYEAEKVIGARNAHGKNQYSPKEASPTLLDKPNPVLHAHFAGYKRKTADRIGDEYHISHATVEKYGRYAKAIDTLYRRDTAIAPRILSGEVKMSHENTVALAESGRQLVHSFDVVSENGATRLTYKETREQMAKQQRIIAARKDNQGTIKDMPMADPDAEVASLSFTIPSWISSMTRIHNLGAVDRASVNAARRLQQQLLKLNETVEQMLAAIKEKA